MFSIAAVASADIVAVTLDRGEVRRNTRPANAILLYRLGRATVRHLRRLQERPVRRISLFSTGFASRIRSTSAGDDHLIFVSSIGSEPLRVISFRYVAGSQASVMPNVWLSTKTW